MKIINYGFKINFHFQNSKSFNKRFYETDNPVYHIDSNNFMQACDYELWLRQLDDLLYHLTWSTIMFQKVAQTCICSIYLEHEIAVHLSGK